MTNGTKYVDPLRNGIKLILINQPEREHVGYQMERAWGAPPHNSH